MKKIIAIALGVLCIATFAAPSAHAAGQYPIVIETNGDAASVMAYAPQHRAIHMTAYVPADAARSYALENADYYEFRITVCGKTHSRWNRTGSGVKLLVSCGS